MNDTNTEVSATEVIMGAAAISKALGGLTRRQVYNLVENGTLPVIKLGNAVAIRKVKLIQYLEQLEAA